MTTRTNTDKTITDKANNGRFRVAATVAAGFWRCARHWPQSGVLVEAEAFTAEQWARLRAEPMLRITDASAPDPGTGTGTGTGTRKTTGGDAKKVTDTDTGADTGAGGPDGKDQS